ncbi:MAG TPA: phosphatidylglycerophosphatase A [Alphaproteobacteria bacterium]|nr:phosphatidylglycerophosphatase A [Alphaproteobacteria bacterium]
MTVRPLLRPMPAGLDFWHPAALIATWGGVGLMRLASGTWGSLAALPFAWAIASAGGPAGLLIAAALVCLVGVWASEYVCRSGEKDSSAIVVDEVAGQWLALVPAGLDPALMALGFVCFRLFDIVKPWPASWVDRNLGRGPGVMLDDVAAGIYAAAVVWLLSFWI